MDLSRKVQKADFTRVEPDTDSDSDSDSELGPELRQVLRPLLAWWWALLIVPLICGGLAYYQMGQGPRYYQAHTQLQFGQSLGQTDTQLPSPPIPILGPTYKEMVLSDQFLQLVAAQLNNSLNVPQLQQEIIAYHTYWTNTIDIQVTDTNPARTLAVLDSVNTVLINQTPQLKQVQLNFIKQRQAELQKLNTQNQQQIDLLNSQLEGASNNQTNDTISTLTATLGDLKDQINTNTAELQGLNLYLNQIETYELHVEIVPILINTTLGSKPLDGALAMGAVGLALMLVLIFVLEKINDRTSTVSQIENITGQSAAIVVHPGNKNLEHDWDMLASDIVAAYYQTESSANLLVIYEQASSSRSLPPAVEGLSVALVRQGVKIRVATAKNLLASSSSVSSAGPASPGTETGSLECKLVIQSWPTTVQNLRYLTTKCAGVIILYELNRSKKSNLTHLTAFFKNSPLSIKNIIEV